jgi:hypothetical protein
LKKKRMVNNTITIIIMVTITVIIMAITMRIKNIIPIEVAEVVEVAAEVDGEDMNSSDKILNFIKLLTNGLIWLKHISKALRQQQQVHSNQMKIKNSTPPRKVSGVAFGAVSAKSVQSGHRFVQFSFQSLQRH